MMDKIDFFHRFNSDEFSQEDKIRNLTLTDFKSFIEDNNYQYNTDVNKSVENFLNYKFLGKYDCDKIFGEMFDYEYTDTMNSFWTLFKQYIKINMPNEFELENGEIKKEYIDIYKKQYSFELTSQQLWITHILNMINQKNIQFDTVIRNFAVLTHTIGNFIEVPVGFNVNRYTNTLDYFDLTLLCIYKWYQTGSDFWLEILLNNNKEAIQNTKEWLLSYDMELKDGTKPTMWEAFVVSNDLNMYLDDNYQPMEFFENHFNNFEVLLTDRQKFANYNEKARLLNPQNIEDLTDCIRNISVGIHSRGEEIVKYELEEINDSQEEYENDFDEVIVTNRTETNFPIRAYVMNLEEFIERADKSFSVNKIYVDIDILDKELYDNLKATGVDIIYVRITPSYIQEDILDWRI